MSRKHDDEIKALQQIPLFGGCAKNELELIAKAAEHATFQVGEHLTQEGQLGYEFFVIIDGEVEVKKGSKSVATLGSGEFLGELSLLDRAPRNATCTATKPTSVLLLGYQEFWGVISAAPGLDKKLLIAMAARLRDLEKRLV